MIKTHDIADGVKGFTMQRNLLNVTVFVLRGVSKLITELTKNTLPLCQGNHQLKKEIANTGNAKKG